MKKSTKVILLTPIALIVMSFASVFVSDGLSHFFVWCFYIYLAILLIGLAVKGVSYREKEVIKTAIKELKNNELPH